MTYHFWDGENIVSHGPLKNQAGFLCVDTSCTTTFYRYGKFQRSGNWQHVPLDQFPPEFRAHLLLLGVS